MYRHFVREWKRDDALALDYLTKACNTFANGNHFRSDLKFTDLHLSEGWRTEEKVE